MQILANANQIEAATGANFRSIRRWLADAGVPTQRDGRKILYPRDTALAVIAQHQRPRKTGPSALAAQAADFEKLRRQCAAAELALANTRARLVEIEEGILSGVCDLNAAAAQLRKAAEEIKP